MELIYSLIEKTPPLIPQIIGIAAVITFFLSYQQKNRINIIIFNSVSRVLYIIQYFLLGAFSGAVLNILGTVSCVLAGKKNRGFIKKYAKLILTIINAVIIAVGLLLCKNLFDLLPIAGVILHTAAVWLNNERLIRWVSLIGCPFWFAYNISSAAYGALVGDILTMSSIILAMIRFRNNSGDRKIAEEKEKFINEESKNEQF